MGFNIFWGNIMTLSPHSNNEFYESSLIEDLVYLDILDGNPQEVLKRLPHSRLVPKYDRLDYILTNPPNSTTYYDLTWNRGWQQLRTQVCLQVRSEAEVVRYDLEQSFSDMVGGENYEIPDVSL